MQPKPDNYFYKKHADHAGFKAPPELQAVLDSQRKRDTDTAINNPEVVVQSPAQ